MTWRRKWPPRIPRGRWTWRRRGAGPGEGIRICPGDPRRRWTASTTNGRRHDPKVGAVAGRRRLSAEIPAHVPALAERHGYPTKVMGHLLRRRGRSGRRPSRSRPPTCRHAERRGRYPPPVRISPSTARASPDLLSYRRGHPPSLRPRTIEIRVRAEIDAGTRPSPSTRPTRRAHDHIPPCPCR